MADILDTNIGTGPNNLNLPGVNVSTSAREHFPKKDIEFSSTKIGTINREKEEKSKAAQNQTNANQLNIPQSVLNLQRNVLNQFKILDSTVKNNTERRVQKEQIEKVALGQVNIANKPAMIQFFKELKNKTTLEPSGIFTTEDIIGKVERRSPQEILDDEFTKDEMDVDEVLPNTLDSFDAAINSAEGEVATIYTPQKLNESIIGLKNNARKLKRISRDFFKLSSLTPAEQQPTLIKKAQNDYIGAAASLLSTFQSPEFLRTVKLGATEADVEAALQAVSRDILSEITDNNVPVDVAKIQDHITKTIGQIRESHKLIRNQQIEDIEKEEKILKLQNDIQKHNARRVLGAPRIEASRGILEGLQIQLEIANEAQQVSIDTPEVAELKEKLALFSLSGSEDAITALEKQKAYQQAVDTSLGIIPNINTIDSKLNELAKLTNSNQVVGSLGKIKSVIPSVVKDLVIAINNKQVTEEEAQNIIAQLQDLETDVEAKLLQHEQDQRSFWDKIKGTKAPLPKEADIPMLELIKQGEELALKELEARQPKQETKSKSKSPVPKGKNFIEVDGSRKEL